jgi:hypothetical protein
MPTRKEVRSKSKASSPTVTIITAGRKYTIDFGEMSALDELDFASKLADYGIVNATLMGVLSGQITLYGVAGVLWLHRRKTKKALTFEEVAEKLKLSDVESVELDDGEPDGEDGEPASPED